MRIASLGVLALPFLAGIQALHFYFDSGEKRCFLEELPSDTIVEGHYRALLWNQGANEWQDNPTLGIIVHVSEMANGHVVVNTRGPSDGRFTFTSHDPGDHNICLSTNLTSGYFATDHIKMYLDINVGSSKHDPTHDVAHVNSLAGKVRELNSKIEEIQREQKYMREVEVQFRDASERVNSRAVWWSFIQMGVLVGAAGWQLRYLKDYFGDKKLR